ncbi:MAG: Holliday junction branch migration protein RuvA [Clostridiales bacterium]|nr:Holliday junction branch migration protein RuvA [Clostridiales bacterium]
MIYSLTGKISMENENTVVVDTGSVSFEVVCSSYTAYKLAGRTEPQTILTYLQVREDGMTLFGFIDKKEKMLFNDLLLVSGVGPKMAITILSGLPIDDIIRAIISSDVKLLSSIKGLGKKTTERIVLELNSKLGGETSLESLISNENGISFAAPAMKKEMEEAYDVLIGMGLTKNEAMESAKQNYKDGMTSEQLVVACLKNLHK